MRGVSVVVTPEAIWLGGSAAGRLGRPRVARSSHGVRDSGCSCSRILRVLQSEYVRFLGRWEASAGDESGHGACAWGHCRGAPCCDLAARSGRSLVSPAWQMAQSRSPLWRCGLAARVSVCRAVGSGWRRCCDGSGCCQACPACCDWWLLPISVCCGVPVCFGAKQTHNSLASNYPPRISCTVLRVPLSCGKTNPP